MARRIFVAFSPCSRLFGEALVAALHMVGVEVVALDLAAQLQSTVAIPTDAVGLIVSTNSVSAEALVAVWRRLLSGRAVVVVTVDAEGCAAALTCAGASACVSGGDSLECLVAKIHALRHADEDCVGARSEDGAALAGRGAELTAREREVLQLIASGLSNKQIGSQLEISVSTVKNHVHSILNKLKLSRRRETLLWAVPAARKRQPCPDGPLGADEHSTFLMK